MAVYGHLADSGEMENRIKIVLIQPAGRKEKMERVSRQFAGLEIEFIARCLEYKMPH
jgi:hypothetical protein